MTISRSGSAAEIGGKASALSALSAAQLPIPSWFAVPPPHVVDANAALSDELARAIHAAVGELAPDGALLAVRSSATEEDSTEHSFAGQFESYLYVRPDDVPERVRDVWRAAFSDRVLAYRRERGVLGPVRPPAALVQRMIDPDVAGVAFSADPASGRRGVAVVTAAYGVGSAIVSGDVDADTYRVSRDGAIVDREIAKKVMAHRRGPDGPREARVPDELATRPALTDAQVLAVAALARTAERFFGRPQDIEWAIAGGELFLLQSRPITSLSVLPDPDGALTIWDNSNIAESYGGVTTPLTFSFARYVYEEVYRTFCRIVGVNEARIAENGDALRAMLGLVRGRIYYNLISWYRILALLPGYRFNRPFMEQMMGVKEGLPPELDAKIEQPSLGAKIADGLKLLRTLFGFVRAYRRLPKSIAEFDTRLDAALGTSHDLTSLRADELVMHYYDLERQLLTRWDAPLVNDFFAMIFYGVLRKLASSWIGDSDGTLQNDLVAGSGDVISAEPAKRISRMAELASQHEDAVDALERGNYAQVMDAVKPHRALHEELTSYLQMFSDRCLEELKLETMTLQDDPTMLFRSVGRLARARRNGASVTGAAPSAPRRDLRGEAEQRAFSALAGHSFRETVFRWVLGNARARVRDRENLRFERTRVFGRIRRIFVELGKRYAAEGVLDDPRDVFYLTVDEALNWARGTSATADLRAVSAARKTEFARYHTMPAPGDRFETRGMVHVGHDFVTPSRALASGPDDGSATNGEQRRGIGCYPGVVRGLARVIRDPRGAVLEPGEILVAERTDPGWIMLFPAARGLLVERGSLLSHSAIVARELGLPAVVSVDGLTTWLRTGDEVELDGRSGEIRVLSRAERAA